MLGWTIFTHSIGMVFRNFGQVLRIALGPALAGGIAMGSTYSLATKIMSEPGVTSSGQAFLLGFLFLVIMWICLLWITVAWHRFILLEEYSRGLLPRFQFDRITAYFGTLFAIGLVTGLPVIAVVFLLGQLSGPGPSGEVMIFGLMAIAMFCGLRLSLTLPAVAIGKTVSFSQAWAATKGKSGALVLLMVLSFAAQYLVQLIFFQLGLIPVVGHVLSLLVIPMINVSILTTIYGVFIEKRDLG